MGRILALDYGTKRTGIAVTDSLQIIATALETVRTHRLLAFLSDYCLREKVVLFVLGMPKNLDLSDTKTTQAVRTLEKQLKKQFPQIPVCLTDERFTSKIALDAMRRGGMKKKDRREKGAVDKISAVLILQSYLEARENRRGSALS